MLRVCRKAAIIIEPYESPVERLLESVGVATRFEHRQSSYLGVSSSGSYLKRDNYVFHWNSRGLESLLNSYYLDSGYRLEMTVGWLTKRVARSPKLIREIGAMGGWAASHIPGSRGNLVTALIIPGASVPAEPRAFFSQGNGDDAALGGRP